MGSLQREEDIRMPGPVVPGVESPGATQSEPSRPSGGEGGEVRPRKARKPKAAAKANGAEAPASPPGEVPVTEGQEKPPGWDKAVGPRGTKFYGKEAREILVDDIDAKVAELWTALENALEIGGEEQAVRLSVSCTIKPPKDGELSYRVSVQAGIAFKTLPVERKGDFDKRQLGLYE